MRLPIQYWKFPPVPAGSNVVEAARKSGDVAKGEMVRLTGVTNKGKFSVEKANGQPSEHWHDLDSFLPNREPVAANAR